MGSLRTAVSTGVARYSNNHIGAANQAQIKHMAELTLTIDWYHDPGYARKKGDGFFEPSRFAKKLG